LLRRTGSGPLPFEGLWRWLTPWNLLEYKGPTEDARPAHLPLLVEVGLGIARRLDEEHRMPGGGRPKAEKTSFWYLANRLGRRFRLEAERLLSGLEAAGPGIWCAAVLRHPMYLVSTVDLLVDEDSLPLHVLALGPAAREQEVGEYLAATESRWEALGGVFSVLHPGVWKEVEAMARRTRRTLTLDIRPAVEYLGLAEVIRQIGKEEVIRQIGKEEVIRQIGEEDFIRQIGAKKIVEQLGVETIAANLPAAKRRALKRLLSEE